MQAAGQQGLLEAHWESALTLHSTDVRSIELPAAQVHAPLAVSAKRGVACAFVGVQRAIVLDLVRSFLTSICAAGFADFP